jgi:hypothetical protein
MRGILILLVALFALSVVMTSVSAHGGHSHAECSCSCAGTNGTLAEVGEAEVDSCDECTADLCSKTYPNQCTITFSFNCTSDATQVVGASFAAFALIVANLF